jgi:protein dithiol oxidoreductase (disulfide-forming)
MQRLMNLLILTLALISAPAVSAEPRLNVDYTTFDAPADLRGPKKITVVHYFSYYCHLCAESAPAIRAWLAKLPEDVQVVQVLVPINDQRGGYPDLDTHIALDRLGKTASLDPLIYDLIHRGKSGFADAPAMRAWLAKQGVAEAALDAEMKGFGYMGALQTSRRWGAAFMNSPATLIPQIAIDGRYLVRYAQYGLGSAPKERAREIAKHVAVMDTLIERVRQERLAAAQ